MRNYFHFISIIKMEQGIEPFSHDLAFLPLDPDLFLGERSREHEDRESTEAPCKQPVLNNSKHAYFRDSAFRFLCEVVAVDEHEVDDGSDRGVAEGELHDALGVVEAVDNGLVLLPLVPVHFSFYYNQIVFTYSLSLSHSVPPRLCFHNLSLHSAFVVQIGHHHFVVGFVAHRRCWSKAGTGWSPSHSHGCHSWCPVHRTRSHFSVRSRNKSSCCYCRCLNIKRAYRRHSGAFSKRLHFLIF